ncbi:hypothetical protein SAMN05880558_10971 [Aeromonas sp. RU39B]|jgi:hypothetical protein|uniref:hypothetical protein n=1 Tax=Aeromonas sp. RU39B TaxID=1907416 RepID=UPI0009559C2D|nr:hypothetical protein [Aeromonas sp. RU39B]SIR14518.1 hypothetical protein SAMN05880558_10971 [Aeromonas sp. RU39B]
MFRLSRRGWNNVIIVGVLLAITLLHRMEQMQEVNSAQRARTLLPADAVVLTWQGPSWQIERIGQSWRSVPDLGLDGAALDGRLHQWSQWLLPPTTALRGVPIVLKVWVAGQAEPIEIGLYQDNGHYAALLPPDRWLTLSAEQYRALLSPHATSQ